MTIFGYIGKYSLNFGIDYILTKLFGEKYRKNIFFLSILIFSCFLLILSVYIYAFYRYFFFEYYKKEDNIKKIQICRICGYIIYSEQRRLHPSNSKKRCRSCCVCCKLCCENTQNCCNKTFCNVIKKFCCCCCECCKNLNCICKCCAYNNNDYIKEEEVFHYCFKSKRFCFWLNKFAANETVKKIFPYVVLYFILQLTTIGFDIQYEKIKYSNISIKIWLPLFIATFFLFFYFTLSFSRFVTFIRAEKNKELDSGRKNTLNISSDSNCENKNLKKDEHNLSLIIESDNENNSNSNNDLLIEKKTSNESVNSNKNKGRKDWISLLSNKILNGTFGILLFNGVYSLIFSLYYLLSGPREEESFSLNDYLIIIPILMTKFHYFILNYYSIYTSETTQKFELISSSSLISFYILLFNAVVNILKSLIPEEKNKNQFNYFNIFYFIQIISSIIPTFVVAIFIVGGLIYSTGILDCLYYCSCKKCKEKYCCHQFLFCLCSFICCFGGLWIRINNFKNEEYECCSTRDYCGIGNCNIYCKNNELYCCYEDNNYSKDGSSCCYCKICNCFMENFNELNALFNIN